MAARGTVIVGALESQRAENTVHLLGPTPDKVRFPPTITTNPCTGLIGKISVEALLDRLAGQLQNLLANRDLQSLEIQVGHRLAPQQDLNLLNDVDGQQIGEEVFF